MGGGGGGGGDLDHIVLDRDHSFGTRTCREPMVAVCSDHRERRPQFYTTDHGVKGSWSGDYRDKDHLVTYSTSPRWNCHISSLALECYVYYRCKAKDF